jgi:hypothetical protein
MTAWNPVPSTRTVAGKALSSDVTLENMTIQFNSTSQTAYNGSTARTYNITPSAIGALPVVNASASQLTQEQLDSTTLDY